MGRHRIITRCMLCDRLLKAKRNEAQLRVDPQIIVTTCRPCKKVVQRYNGLERINGLWAERSKE